MKKLFFTLIFMINLISSAQAIELKKSWELDGFSMPESIRTSTNHKWIYVSNVNAKESGYISRLSKDGKVDNYQWIKGLNNPAGIDMFEDKLYVGDGSQVHIIDVKKGTLLRSITSKEAKALNDVTISKSGQVFISDIATGKIFTIKEDKLVIWFEAPEIKHPNGLFVKDNHLFIANYGSKLSLELKPQNFGAIYKVSLSDKSYNLIPSTYKLGSLDGLITFDNSLLVTSGTTGELYAITPKERILIGSFEKGLADISINGKTLYAPFIFNGKIEVYTIN